ncbi:hypothetical protein ACQPZ8_37455 [Actinomadura nitritigenes]|uniref:hypothetical protein n=1 Tax=Actinomadura nitritigenes TaxID=134602 RepID=UPI003D8D4B5B
MTAPDHLRLAMTALSPRERRALIDNVHQAAGKWRDLLPRVSAVWAALADELRDVEELDQARRAAGPEGRPPAPRARATERKPVL